MGNGINLPSVARPLVNLPRGCPLFRRLFLIYHLHIPFNTPLPVLLLKTVNPFRLLFVDPSSPLDYTLSDPVMQRPGSSLASTFNRVSISSDATYTPYVPHSLCLQFPELTGMTTCYCTCRNLDAAVDSAFRRAQLYEAQIRQLEVCTPLDHLRLFGE